VSPAKGHRGGGGARPTRGNTPKVPGGRSVPGGTGRNPGRSGSAGVGGPGDGPLGSGPGAPGAGRPRRARPTPPSGPPVDVHDPDGVRLQKVLAQAGLGSRRACEALIAAGRVEVDGHRVTELGVRIDPRRAAVHVDGMRIQLDDSLVYLALNKPVGVVSAMSDPQGRPCLAEYVTGREERLFHVGRLDVETEGLILLTNDGELAHRLAHPSYEVPKTYLVEVPGPLPRDIGRHLLSGVDLDDGLACVDAFKVVDARPGKALIEIVLHDGRNRVVRRMLEAVGHPVEQLVRTQLGPIRLGDLRTGRTRVISGAELGSLMASVGL
jgi:23S rRNA pseudouridine2605 synthase